MGELYSCVPLRGQTDGGVVFMCSLRGQTDGGVVFMCSPAWPD